MSTGAFPGRLPLSWQIAGRREWTGVKRWAGLVTTATCGLLSFYLEAAATVLFARITALCSVEMPVYEDEIRSVEGPDASGDGPKEPPRSLHSDTFCKPSASRFRQSVCCRRPSLLRPGIVDRRIEGAQLLSHAPNVGDCPLLNYLAINDAINRDLRHRDLFAVRRFAIKRPT